MLNLGFKGQTFYLQSTVQTNYAMSLFYTKLQFTYNMIIGNYILKFSLTLMQCKNYFWGLVIHYLRLAASNLNYLLKITHVIKA